MPSNSEMIEYELLLFGINYLDFKLTVHTCIEVLLLNASTARLENGNQPVCLKFTRIPEMLTGLID